MKTPRPGCRCCGKQLPKGTVWQYTKGYFLTRQDLLPLLGPDQVITSVSYANGHHDANDTWVAAPPGTTCVHAFRTWDGKSWGHAVFNYDKKTGKVTNYRYPGVCSMKCLREFAAAAAEAFPDFTMWPSAGT